MLGNSYFLHILVTIGEVILQLVASVVEIGLGFSAPSFGVVDCNPNNCPGSSYNLVTAAWANIGYMTHADFLHLVTGTNFGAWAPLLYVIGAIGGLIGVAINSPPRNYVWFFLGPCIFNFLEFTTTNVQGVAWKVAGRIQPMEQVWEDAETGLGNTTLVKRIGVRVTREGPSGEYPVAWMLVFLDRLFSASTDGLISWVGIGRQEGTGGADTNLAQKEGDGLGPWYILANLKWGMLENITAVSARDPDVRDALVTFLASECGDHFKRGVDSGNYIAASQSHGAALPESVLKKGRTSITFFGREMLGWDQYKPFAKGMDGEVIPTPRSIVRLFNQKPDQQGSFTQFSQTFSSEERFESGRATEIVCTEYLYTIIQALRWESGHAYWQLVRSAPDGFSRDSLLKSLFYGWDIREKISSPYANNQQLQDFVKQLIFVYLLRNELLFAPQITESGQRFAPSEQTRNFSEQFIRTQGGRAKAAELYNWAVMMPHVQGILTYLVLVFYPFAVMMMVIPGYWKAFFTWISFFAWVKLWDVGFAIVHTLERSVWAMIGNHSSMARVGNMLIQTAGKTGQIKVGESCSGNKLSELCAIPDVKESQPLKMEDAWGLLDRTLLLTGSADLDLSSGYYIYIMSALYFAVPAVAGQLVLGAKAGMAQMATQGISQVAGEAGTASKSATVGEMANKLQTNQGSLTGAAAAKSHRQSGLALQQLENSNAALDAGLSQGRVNATKGALGAAADAARLRAASYQGNANVLKAAAGIAGEGINAMSGDGKGGPGAGGRDGPGAFARGAKVAGAWANFGLAAGQNAEDQKNYGAGARSAMFGANAEWANQRARLKGDGFNDYARKLGQEGDFAAQTATWEAKNDFATHMAGFGGVAGINPGNLNPGAKPTDATGLAMSGNLGAQAQGAARYSGFGFMNAVGQTTSRGNSQYGGSFVGQHWGGGFTMTQTAGTGLAQGVTAGNYEAVKTAVAGSGTSSNAFADSTAIEKAAKEK
jgi:hypothetical protein